MREMFTEVNVAVGIRPALKDQGLTIGVLAVTAVEAVGNVDGIALLNATVGDLGAYETGDQMGVLR